jgi:hypothetical protein
MRGHVGRLCDGAATLTMALSLALTLALAPTLPLAPTLSATLTIALSVLRSAARAPWGTPASVARLTIRALTGWALPWVHRAAVSVRGVELQPERAGLQPERAGLQPECAGLQPECAGLQPGHARGAAAGAWHVRRRTWRARWRHRRGCR